MAGQVAHKLADALPADIMESGHGEQSVATLAALAPQLPAHRAGLSPTAPGAIISREMLCQRELLQNCDNIALRTYSKSLRRIIETSLIITTGYNIP